MYLTVMNVQGKLGNAAKYVTRTQAVKRLQLRLAEFRYASIIRTASSPLVPDGWLLAGSLSLSLSLSLAVCRQRVGAFEQSALSEPLTH